MGEITATAYIGNYHSLSGKIRIKKPKIVNSYWTGDKEGKNKIKEANGEDMVYFHIETEGIPDGKKIRLRLFDKLFLSENDKYKGKTIEKEAIIKGGKGTIELELPDICDNDPDKKESGAGPKIKYLNLFWKINYREDIKNKKMGQHLRVSIPFNKLYIKPSLVDETFPEIYSYTGEQIIILVGYVKDPAIKGFEDAVKKSAHHYAVGKLSHGYMVTSEGKVFGPATQKGGLRQTHEVQFYNSDGRYVITDRAYDFAAKRKDGGKTTTYSVDQYGHHYQGQLGCKVKVLGKLRMAGTIADIFEVFRFGMDPSHDKPFPMPIPGAGIIGMVAYYRFKEMDEVTNNLIEEVLQKELEQAKMEGVGDVYKLIRQYKYKDSRYYIIDITLETASKLINGEYKSIEDIPQELNSWKSEINLLYRKTEHPISRSEIGIIETFFIK